MLIKCPECKEEVSNQAKACPKCGFPVAERCGERPPEKDWIQTASSRKEIGRVDCLVCDARGYYVFSEEAHGSGGFSWCPACGHSGRVVLCEASDGYYAVSQVHLKAFLAGEVHPGEPCVDFVGTDKPEGFRYPQAHEVRDYKSLPNWFLEELAMLQRKRLPK